MKNFKKIWVIKISFVFIPSKNIDFIFRRCPKQQKATLRQPFISNWGIF